MSKSLYDLWQRRLCHVAKGHIVISIRICNIQNDSGTVISRFAAHELEFIVYHTCHSDEERGGIFA